MSNGPPCGITTIGRLRPLLPAGRVRNPCSGRPSRAFNAIGFTLALRSTSIQSLRLIRWSALRATVSYT